MNPVATSDAAFRGGACPTPAYTIAYTGNYTTSADANKPMCENAMNSAYRRMGFGKDVVTSHGFRATASTLLNESGKWHPDAIERALAHGHSNAVRGAYARGQYWDERVAMAQWWSDYLERLSVGAQVVPMMKGASG